MLKETKRGVNLFRKTNSHLVNRDFHRVEQRFFYQLALAYPIPVGRRIDQKPVGRPACCCDQVIAVLYY